jgi:hypothetical protein
VLPVNQAPYSALRERGSRLMLAVPDRSRQGSARIALGPAAIPRYESNLFTAVDRPCGKATVPYGPAVVVTERERAWVQGMFSVEASAEALHETLEACGSGRRMGGQDD